MAKVASDLLERLQAELAGRYHIEGEAGQGGMASVYRAWDEKHGRPVAVKVLRPELAATVGIDRFLREIRIAARLHHPHILWLIDSGDVTGLPYYVMPFLENESLRDRLDRERQLPVEETVRLIGEVADALDYAHAQGIIHRDVKPENIMLEAGHAVVADFGIAQAMSQAGGATLTESGLAVGTPAYMSPEQATGEGHVDARSDVYGLACVAYEMLAGEPPFTGPTAMSVIGKKLSEPVPHLSVVRNGVPPGTDRVFAKALARTPPDRFPSAGAFAAALATPGARPPWRKSRRRPPADLEAVPHRGEQPSPRPAAAAAGPSPLADARRARGRGWRYRVTIAATVALVAMGSLTVIRAGRSRGPAGHGITVLPTETVGLDSTMSTLVTSYLRAALADWDNLDDASLRARAEGQNSTGAAVGYRERPGMRQGISRSGSGLLLTSRAVRAPDGIVVNAELVDAASGAQLAAASVTTLAEDIRTAAGHLLVHLIAEAGRVPDDRLATLDGHDPLAVRFYLMSYYAGREERTRLLQEALEHDSTFALAAMELLDEVFDAVGQIREPPWTAVAATAWRHRDRLSAADRAYVEALVGWLFTPLYSAALHVEMWERAVQAGPDRLRNLRGYALECYRWCSEVTSNWMERVLQAHDALLTAGDSTVDFLERGLEVALLAEDTVRIRRYAQPLPESAQYGRWLAAMGFDADPETVHLSRAITAGELTDYRIGNVAVLTGRGLEDAETIARWDMNSGRTHQLRAMVQARERGRHTEYRMLRERMFQLGATTTRYDVFLSHDIVWEWAFFGEPETDSALDAHEAVLSAIIERVPRAGPDTLATAHCALAELRLARAERTGVDEAITFLTRDAGARHLPVARMCAPLLELLVVRDSSREAIVRVVRRLNDVMRHRPLEIGNGAGMVNVEIMLAGAANLELGRAMLRLGFPEAGLQIIRRRPYRAGLWGLFGFHVDFLLVEARLLAAAGASAEALARYDLYFRLRPDPPDLATWRLTWETARAERLNLLSAEAGGPNSRASEG